MTLHHRQGQNEQYIAGICFVEDTRLVSPENHTIDVIEGHSVSVQVNSACQIMCMESGHIYIQFLFAIVLTATMSPRDLKVPY